MIVLGIGAHPDDVELGAGGTLIKHKENDDEVNVIIFTYGEADGTPVKVRRKEINASMKILNPNSVDIYGFSAYEANYAKQEFIDALKKSVKKIKPDRIYVHSPYDYHQVHLAVTRCSLIASRDVKQIFLYETLSSTTPEFIPNAYVDISSTIVKKLKCSYAYRSQSNKYYLNPKAILTLANYRYIQAKLGNKKNGAAEAFYIYKFVQ